MFRYEPDTRTLILPQGLFAKSSAEQDESDGEYDRWREDTPAPSINTEELLKVLQQNPVEIVVLDQNILGPEDWEAIVPAMEGYSGLREIHLRAISVGLKKKDIEKVLHLMIRSLQASINIHTLHLSVNPGFGNFPDLIFSLITSFPHLRSLNIRYIGLGSTPTKETLWQKLSQLPSVPDLTVLEIGSNNLGDKGSIGLGDLLRRMLNLQVLKMFKLRIGKEVANVFPLLLPSLRELWIGDLVLIRTKDANSSPTKILSSARDMTYLKANALHDLGRLCDTLAASPQLEILNIESPALEGDDVLLDSHIIEKILLSTIKTGGVSPLKNINIKYQRRIDFIFVQFLIGSIESFPNLELIEIEGTGISTTSPAFKWLEKMLVKETTAGGFEVNAGEYRGTDHRIDMQYEFADVQDDLREKFRGNVRHLNAQLPWTHRDHAPKLPSFGPAFHYIEPHHAPLMPPLAGDYALLANIDTKYYQQASEQFEKQIEVAKNPKKSGMVRLKAEENALFWQTPARLQESHLEHHSRVAHEEFGLLVHEYAASVGVREITDTRTIHVLEKIYLGKGLHLELIRKTGMIDKYRTNSWTILSPAGGEWATDVLVRNLHSLRLQDPQAYHRYIVKLFSPSVVRQAGIFWDCVGEDGVIDEEAYSDRLAEMDPLTDSMGQMGLNGSTEA